MHVLDICATKLLRIPDKNLRLKSMRARLTPFYASHPIPHVSALHNIKRVQMRTLVFMYYTISTKTVSILLNIITKYKLFI